MNFKRLGSATDRLAFFHSFCYNKIYTFAASGQAKILASSFFGPVRSYSSASGKISKSEVLGLGPNSKLLKQYKESLGKLSEVQREAAIGLMLGDASLQTQNKGKTYRLKFEWGDKSKIYMNHVYALFDEWVLTEPHKKVRTSPAGNEVINWGFQTLSHEAFNFLAELFLDQSKKIISTDLIKNHLTPRGLAYWFSSSPHLSHAISASSNMNINVRRPCLPLSTKMAPSSQALIARGF